MADDRWSRYCVSCLSILKRFTAPPIDAYWWLMMNVGGGVVICCCCGP